MSDLCLFYSNIGVVESVSDGIINILGLQKVVNGEMVEIFILFFFNDIKRLNSLLEEIKKIEVN